MVLVANFDWSKIPNSRDRGDVQGVEAPRQSVKDSKHAKHLAHGVVLINDAPYKSVEAARQSLTAPWLVVDTEDGDYDARNPERTLKTQAANRFGLDWSMMTSGQKNSLSQSGGCRLYLTWLEFFALLKDKSTGLKPTPGAIGL